jgi:hypothetical protein
MTLLGCGPTVLTSGGMPDEDSIRALLTDGNYKAAGLVPLTQAAVASALGDEIKVWITGNAAQEYLRVSPDRSGSGAWLPPGTTLVREVWKGVTLKKVTVMVKAPVGYYPDGRDYWYGVMSPAGDIMWSTDGKRLAGRLGRCAACHINRGADDGLFGIPRDHR